MMVSIKSSIPLGVSWSRERRGSTRLTSSTIYRDNVTSSPPSRHADTIRPGMLAGYASPEMITFVSSTTRRLAINATARALQRRRSQPSPLFLAHPHNLRQFACLTHQSDLASAGCEQTIRHLPAPQQVFHP